MQRYELTLSNWHERALKAEREIERLTHDLSVNATMLARQCDLARDAERETLAVSRRCDESLKEEYRNRMALEEQIAELKAERDKAIEDVTILTQQRRNLLDERAALKAEIEQWKDLAFAQGMKLKMGEAHDET